MARQQTLSHHHHVPSRGEVVVTSPSSVPLVTPYPRSGEAIPAKVSRLTKQRSRYLSRNKVWRPSDPASLALALASASAPEFNAVMVPQQG